MDLTAKLQERERQLEHLAEHDPLTGLPNRLLFADRLGQVGCKDGGLRWARWRDLPAQQRLGVTGFPFGDHTGGLVVQVNADSTEQ
ncbi:GGDEF domain-containing protein [uncultured Thiodictyon sp.]|uniref:GGDEF domain-containing protein n=1 Tax=uncultured Thiodictyon sp. TaxID=1846217 RepID=UPI00342C22FE